MACKEGQFDVVEQMLNNQLKAFSIYLNAQYVNGMTPYKMDQGINVEKMKYKQIQLPIIAAGK